MLNINSAKYLVQGIQKDQPKIYELLNNLIDAIGTLDSEFDAATFKNTIQAQDGIAFPNFETASTNPNVLDDYEEGTWIPLDNSGAGLVFTYSFTSRYVKVGKLVFITGDFTFPVTASGANASMKGLPFTSHLLSQFDFPIGFTTFAGDIFCIIQPSTKTIGTFINVATGVGLTNVALSAKVMRFTACYMANQ